jgi:hypothetical protein
MTKDAKSHNAKPNRKNTAAISELLKTPEGREAFRKALSGASFNPDKCYHIYFRGKYYELQPW